MNTKVALLFNDMSDNRINEKNMVYNNFGVPIPNVGEMISLDGRYYRIYDRFFVYLNNFDIDLQIIFRCEELN